MGDFLRKPVLQYSVAAAGLLVFCVILLANFGAFAQAPPTAEELLATALNEGPQEDRIEAAVALSNHEDVTLEMLHEVIQKSSLPPVRAAAIAALGNRRDVDSLPVLIDLMEDESELVRGRAGIAVERISGLRMGYNPADTPENREQTIARYRQFWEDCQKPDSKFIEFMRDPDAARAHAEKFRRETHGED